MIYCSINETWMSFFACWQHLLFVVYRGPILLSSCFMITFKNKITRFGIETLPSIVHHHIFNLVSSHLSRSHSTLALLPILLYFSLVSTPTLVSRWLLGQSKMSESVRHVSEVVQNVDQPCDKNVDEREATELEPVQHVHQDTAVRSSSTNATNTSGAGGEAPFLISLRGWWKHYIQLHVPHADCRDHLGMQLSSPVTFSCESHSHITTRPPGS